MISRFKIIISLCTILIGTWGSWLNAAQNGPSAITEIKSSSFDLWEVFMGCPIIYILLLIMSLAAFIIWIYTMMTLRLSEMMPKEFISNIRDMLTEKRFEAALTACQQEDNFTASIVASGIAARKHGPQVMMEAMQSEGKRSGNSLWQRISILNEIAVVAPMLGLLGTVLGLFFAFYDTNRSAESITSIFDGLGIAIGTTVAGLIVAIFAMIFYTTLKFRVVNVLNAIEYEALSLVHLVDVDYPNNSSNRPRFL